MSTKTQLSVILERASKYYIAKHIDSYIEKLSKISNNWKNWVKAQLSVQYIKGTKNTSLYPKLRTGALRNSLSVRRPKLKYVRHTQSGRAQASISIPVYFKPLKDDYGEKLNSSSRFKNSRFYGWKDRVQEELSRRVQERLKGRL